MEDGSQKSAVRLYAVPRRFDLATIMVVTFAYALVLGASRMLKLPPHIVFHIAGFLSAVAIGQALLFRGKKPRLSSALVGAVYVVGVYAYGALTREPSLLQFQVAILRIWFFIALYGVIVGYFGGIAVGSVFLLSDVARKLIQRCKRD